MAFAKICISALTGRNLGQSTINELCRRLYAHDCQLCGEPLGSAPPGLSVDAFGTEERTVERSLAWLHHRDCKEPSWHDCASFHDMTVPLLPHLSTHTFSMVLSPSPFRGLAGPVPIAMLNPSMEAVRLSRSGGGRWRADTEQIFLDRFAMVRGTIGGSLPEVDSGALDCASVRLDGGSLFWLILGDRRWELSAPRPVADVMRAQRGVAVVATTAMDPHHVKNTDFTADDLVAFLDSGEYAMGWVRLGWARDGERRRNR